MIELRLYLRLLSRSRIVLIMPFEDLLLDLPERCEYKVAPVALEWAGGGRNDTRAVYEVVFIQFIFLFLIFYNS